MRGRLSSPDLVGRDDTLAELTGAIRAAAADRPRFVIVRGEAGIGKTRLVRETEVLELVTAGLTNGEVAERLFITRKTAAVHVTHILDKLGVANRVGAAMIGSRAGLGTSTKEGAAGD